RSGRRNAEQGRRHTQGCKQISPNDAPHDYDLYENNLPKKSAGGTDGAFVLKELKRRPDRSPACCEERCPGRTSGVNSLHGDVVRDRGDASDQGGEIVTRPDAGGPAAVNFAHTALHVNDDPMKMR